MPEWFCLLKKNKRSIQKVSISVDADLECDYGGGGSSD